MGKGQGFSVFYFFPSHEAFRPAGCGKTVSALLWIRKSGRTPIWIGLDEYDNTLSAFYRLFCTALFSVVPQDESLMKMVRETAFNASPVESTVEVLSRFSFGDGKYALVFDDFHLITNEEIQKSLIHVLKRIPLSAAVIVLSRSEPSCFFAPLRESGKLALLGAAELAFKRDEIRRFFSSYGRFITEEEAGLAFSLTEGWAIAVSALAVSGNITADRKLTGGLLEEYIETQIWDKFDQELRLFLSKTSAVDEFSVELCRRLTQNAKAEQVLDMLCGGNIFISRQEDTYRYHHLFLAFLREKAKKEIEAGYGDLYQTAAEYYLENEDYFNALRYFVHTEDSKGTAAALYYFLKYTGKSSSEIARISFIRELPAEALDKNPVLYAGCAWYALLFGDIHELFYYLDKLYARIADLVEEYPMFLEGMLVLSMIDHRQSLAQQTAKQRMKDTLTLGGANAPKRLGDNFPFFHRTFRDFSHFALGTETHREKFLQTFFMISGSDYPIIEAGLRSGLLYEQNRLKEALSLVTPNPKTESTDLKFLSRQHIASCLFAMGKNEDAAECRSDIKAFLENENLLYLLPVFSAYETKIKLFDGSKAVAAAWFDNYFVTEQPDLVRHRLFISFTTVRAYIVLGEFQKAELLCQKLIAIYFDFSRLLEGIEASVLLSIIRWMVGKKQEAVVSLQALLTTAEPYHFIRVFADEGNAILPILKRILRKSDAETESTPAYKYVREIYQAAYEQSKKHKGIACAPEYKPIKLSKQQKYILELLAKGYKNAEIIALTGLSINTIRSHTRAIYQKLEVSSAMDAVFRARELELID